MRPLESPRRLSRSLLWDLQRRAYAELGPGAWKPDGVPQQVTSNPLLAAACAELVHAWLDDLREQGVSGPVLLLDLGAGSGRFAWYLLRALRDSGPAALPWRLVLTDVAQRNLDAYASHELLAPFVADGLLDFAAFDAADPRPLQLLDSGEVLDAAAAPAVLAFALYFFCTIRHDLFRVERGVLHEVHVALESDEDSPGVDGVRWSEHVEPFAPYGEPLRDAILEAHAAAFSARDTTFPFPEEALRCVEWLRGLSGRTLLLAVDKGYVRLEDLADLDRLPIDRHGGTFSCMVDFAAVLEYVRRLGGDAFAAPGSEDPLATVLCAMGEPGGWTRTRRAWQRAFGTFAPWDAMRLTRAAIAAGNVPPELALRLLRLNRFDPHVLMMLAGHLDASAQVDEWLAGALSEAVERAADSWFPFAAAADHPGFAAGSILQGLGRFERAVEWYDRFLTDIPNATAAYNRALCMLDLGRRDEALGDLNRALDLDAEHVHARRMRMREFGF